ncbi:MAG: hypothetical protein OEZ47_01160 [Gammaproteobacteria bacterium]|nr:hypothetical protein [Gammaproteobacteria bacterium]
MNTLSLPLLTRKSLIIGLTLVLAACSGDPPFEEPPKETLPKPAVDNAWTTHSYNGEYKKVIYGGGKFLAVGEHGHFAYSTNATTWTKSRVGGETFVSVLHDGAKFVALLGGHSTAFSADGINWTQHPYSLKTGIGNSTCTANPGMTDIVYTGTKYITVGIGLSCSSTDGITWANSFDDLAGVGSLVRAAYKSTLGTAVLTGATSPLFYHQPAGSSNWTGWGSSANNIFAIATGVSGGNDVFVFAGDTSGDANNIVVSTGPSAGTAYTGPSAKIIDLAYGNNLWVALSDAGEIYTSADPATGAAGWSLPTAVSNMATSVAMTTGSYVVVGKGQTIMSSTNATSWTQRSSPAGMNVKTAHYANNTLLAIATNATTNPESACGIYEWDITNNVWLAQKVDLSGLTTCAGSLGFDSTNNKWYRTDETGFRFSTDATANTWDATPTYTKSTIQPTAVRNLGGNIFLVGGTMLGNTTDAVSAVTLIETGATDVLRDIAYNGTNLYVAVGDNGTAIKSSDGISWTAAVTPPGTAQLKKLAYGAGVFVAVGDANTIYYSADGDTWTAGTPVAYGTAYNMNTVIHDGTQFLAAGDSRAMQSSVDGATWALVAINNTTSTSHIRGLAWNGTTLVAVGDAGARYTTTAPSYLTNWADQTGAGAYSYGDITWSSAQGRFMAVSAISDIASVSTDGATWSELSTGTGGQTVTASTTNVLANKTSDSVKIISSANALSTTLWHEAAGTAHPDYVNNQFVAVNTSSVFHSTNGGSWVLRPVASAMDPGQSQELTSPVAFGNGIYMIGMTSYGGLVSPIVSTDLSSWTKVNVSEGVSSSSVLFANGSFTGFNGLSTLSSTDTVSWTAGNSWGAAYDFSDYLPFSVDPSGNVMYNFPVLLSAHMFHDGTNYVGDMWGSGLIAKGTSTGSLEVVATNLPGGSTLVNIGSKYFAYNGAVGSVATRAPY